MLFQLSSRISRLVRACHQRRNQRPAGTVVAGRRQDLRAASGVPGLVSKSSTDKVEFAIERYGSSTEKDRGVINSHELFAGFHDGPDLVSPRHDSRCRLCCRPGIAEADTGREVPVAAARTQRQKQRNAGAENLAPHDGSLPSPGSGRIPSKMLLHCAAASSKASKSKSSDPKLRAPVWGSTSPSPLDWMVMPPSSKSGRSIPSSRLHSMNSSCAACSSGERSKPWSVLARCFSQSLMMFWKSYGPKSSTEPACGSSPGWPSSS
ncbi:MAG: hypothetical protein ACI8Y4_003808 [Candidatus Poriferisodalaceae bacterium]